MKIRERLGDFTFHLEQKRALIHLEALELVSEQAELRLNIQLESLSSTNLDRNEDIELIWDYLQWDQLISDDFYSDLNKFDLIQCIDDCKNQFAQIDLKIKLPNLLLLTSDDENQTVQNQWIKLVCILNQFKSVHSYDRLLKVGWSMID